MADQVRLIEGIPVKFVDNGDGSYAVSSAGSGGGGGGGSINITTLATLAEQEKQTGNLTVLVNQTVGLATAAGVTALTAKVVEANLPVYNVEVTSYDSFNNPLVIVYRDRTTLATVMTQTCTYDGVGRFVSSVLS